MSYFLFLDDERFPPEDGQDWIVVRTVAEAQASVRARGWPIYVSFDHDLGPEQPTGKAFADWMVERAIAGEPVFPEGWHFYVHSRNPVGAANIEGLIRGYLKQRQDAPSEDKWDFMDCRPPHKDSPVQTPASVQAMIDRQQVDEAEVVAFDVEDFTRLRKVMSALYAPERVTFDRQRDLANVMDAILGRAVPLKLDQIGPGKAE